MSKKDDVSPPLVGAISLLTIFAVLCLCVFSLLSLSTALAEKRLLDKTLENVEAYYQSEYQAELTLAQLRKGEKVDGVQQDGDIYRYTHSINDIRTFYAEVQKKEDCWRILRWQSLTDEEIYEETKRELWDGE